MRLPALALSVVAGLAGPLSAPVSAQEAFIWTYFAAFPIFPSEARLNLIATQEGALAEENDGGLPGGLIWGRCLSELDAGEVALRFETGTGAAVAGDTVTMTVSGGGLSASAAGTIVNRGLDPTGGPELILPNDSAVLQILRDADVVTYGVDGPAEPPITFDLSTNRAYVAAFLDDCAAVGAGGVLQRGPDAGPGAPVSAGLVPDVGPEISGHVWSRFTEVSPDVFQTIVRIFYAVPETDDVLVSGQCFIGAQGPLVAFSAAADIAGLADGDAADLRFTTAEGRSVDVPGSVVGSFAEVGISGVEVVLQMSDPAWLVIAGDETLRIERVGAQGGFTLTGNGPNSIGTFLSDCADIGALSTGAGQAPSAPIGAQPGFLSCEAFGRVSSRDTGAPLVLNFVNATENYRGLVWIDPNGNLVDIAGLNPGEEIAFNTDPGHVWMATTGPGDCLEMIQPTARQVEYRLTVAN